MSVVDSISCPGTGNTRPGAGHRRLHGRRICLQPWRRCRSRKVAGQLWL